jgi:gliding motility associated protien GldN
MKKLLILLLSIALMAPVIAQVNDGIYEKEHVPSRKPVPYPYLREADAMWSKKIVRNLPLREKLNHPLYYPTEQIGSRMSLTALLMYGINNEGLTSYDGMVDDNFTVPMTKAQLNDNFGAGMDTIVLFNENTGVEEFSIIEIKPDFSECKQYLMKEEWVFDNQRSLLEVRIVGLTAIREYYRKSDLEREEVLKRKAFMIYFPEARRLFANREVFNPRNDAERRTFDDIFFKRKFSSFIVQESNVYDNRGINEYTTGIAALQEAERVKMWIGNFEHDMWEF